MTTDTRALQSALDASRTRMSKARGDGGIAQTHAAAIRQVGAWTLDPAPKSPAHHLAAAHARARQHLGRLLTYDPAAEVLSVMTGELFTRLTDPEPAALTKPAGITRYTYTPRKMLRRVLDHALDHLNQIDQ